MKDLYRAIDSLNAILNEAPPLGRQDGPGTRQGTTPPKPAPTGQPAYKSVGDALKAVQLPGRQGASDPAQSAKNIAAATPKPAPKPQLGNTGVGRQDGPAALKPAALKPAAPAAPAAIEPDQAAAQGAAAIAAAPKSAAPAQANITKTSEPSPTKVAAPKPAASAPAAPAGSGRVTYQSLAKASGIADPNKIKPGQEIKLPGGGSYKVKSGDTLSGIAQNVRLGKIGGSAPAPAAASAPAPAAQKAAPPATSAPAADDFQSPDDMMNQPVAGTTPDAAGEFGTSRKVSTVQPPTTRSTRGQGPQRSAQASAPAMAMPDETNPQATAGPSPTEKPQPGFLDRIGAGISSLFKSGPSAQPSRRTQAPATQMAMPSDDGSDAPAPATATAATAGDAVDQAVATRGYATAADIEALPNATTTDRSGNITKAGRPRQPSDAEPTATAATTAPTKQPKGRMARMQALQRQRVAQARKQGQQDSASGKLANVTLPGERPGSSGGEPVVARPAGLGGAPERGVVPGQGAGTRTVSVGGQQVRGAEADAAIAKTQNAADMARLRMGAAQAGMSVKDYAAAQNKANKAAADRMMKTAKASDAGVF